MPTQHRPAPGAHKPAAAGFILALCALAVALALPRGAGAESILSLNALYDEAVNGTVGFLSEANYHAVASTSVV